MARNQALRVQERERVGRKAEPSAGSIDSQRGKTTAVPGARGDDAGKKVKGRKRHIVVDTLGNLPGHLSPGHLSPGHAVRHSR